jgi:DNA-binding NtrC family response regulator
MAVSSRKRLQTFPAVTVLVVDRDDDIRYALGNLLQDEGYAVLKAETLREAEMLIDAAPNPTVMVIGDAEVVDHPAPQCFLTLAADPVTSRACLFLMSTPPRCQVPALIHQFKEAKGHTIEKPYELASLLEVIAAAASMQLGNTW